MRARASGAHVVAGGERPADEALANGFYYAPTVLLPTSQANEIVRQEVFGPVLCMLPFDDEVEGARLAIDTIYGLAASVWTRDVFRVNRMAARIQAGTVWIKMRVIQIHAQRITL